MIIYDTTLRDGEQGSEVRFSIRDKLEIARALDEFKVDYIELGWPASSKKEMQCFLEAAGLGFKNAEITAFGATRKKGIAAEEDSNLKAIIESRAKTAAIFGKSWIEHVEKQLRLTPEENLDAIRESVEFLKSNRLVVFYDAEHYFDGFKENSEYALKCLKAASGADTLVLCDTNGGCLPSEIREIITKTKKFLEANRIGCRLGIHCHNDSGMAVANTIEAIGLGIEHIQGTVNGFGERTGNADLCQLLPNIKFKLKKNLRQDLTKLSELSDMVYTLANIRPISSQPFVGKNAFSHKGGIHVDAVSKGASYEHINPEAVGNKRGFILSELSGKANIVGVAGGFGIAVDKNDERALRMLREVENLEGQGYDIGELKAEQFLLVQRFFMEKNELFKVEEWKISTERKGGEFSECIIEGRVNGKKKRIVSSVKGGPVDATFHALKKLIAGEYKGIGDITLINYKVMIAEDKGAESSVRVYIEFRNHNEEWGTVGVSPNILEASLEAIEKGFRYFLLKSNKA